MNLLYSILEYIDWKLQIKQNGIRSTWYLLSIRFLVESVDGEKIGDAAVNVVPPSPTMHKFLIVIHDTN